MPDPIGSAAARDLRARIQGELLLPEDAGYDDARAMWNGRFDPRPLAVVRCLSTADVIVAVGFARENGLPLSVRGGGHSYAGHSVGDDALAIDLSAMDTVTVDSTRKTAVAGPGATWATFDAASQRFGLATTGATVSTVGVAGFALGGGTGYLARKLGLGIDNLVSLEVVTANGRVLRASEAENADLFWAMRGGSGNFGVVTSFEFRLHSVGPEVVTAQAFHPMESAGEVLRLYRELAASAPDELTVYAFALRVPPVEPFPREQHGKPAVALVACHCGATTEGEAMLQVIADSGDPFLSMVQSLPYVAAQQAFDAGMPKGLRWYSRAHYLAELSDDAIETFSHFVEALPGAFTMAYFEPMGGAIARVDSGATAFPHRDAAFGLHIFPGWSDPSEDEPMMRWARDFHAAMAAHATGGVYVNLLGDDEAERVPNAYGANYDRLARLKAEWDPENSFSINHNVPPHA